MTKLEFGNFRYISGSLKGDFDRAELERINYRDRQPIRAVKKKSIGRNHNGLRINISDNAESCYSMFISNNQLGGGGGTEKKYLTAVK